MRKEYQINKIYIVQQKIFKKKETQMKRMKKSNGEMYAVQETTDKARIREKY
jgi:hypothetical protein